MTNTWHTQSIQDVFSALKVSENGLSTSEVTDRRKTYGVNELQERAGKSPWRMLWEQFTQMMVLILIAAAVVSAFLGKETETVAIGAIVVLFAVLGFIQEYRAERAMAALKKMAVPNVRVLRDGTLQELPAHELVPGDTIVLEAGNAVPADVRFLESFNLRIQEAALTGESEPVEKQSDLITGDEVPLGDRRNMGYLGTVVTYGRGRAVVVATGMQTELGKIASLIQDVASEITPLQKRLDQAGKILAITGLISAALVMVIGLLRDEPLIDMFLTAISIAVAVVPEGLPAVVTITLALGAQRMLRRNALIRKLPAVETLGSVTVICSDKTGTLTENRMTVMVVDAAGERLDITETLRLRQPEIAPDDCKSDVLNNIPLPINLTLVVGALCNDAVLQPGKGPGCLRAIGDPTEGALLIAAAQAGLIKEVIQTAAPRVAEVPFDSNRKRMTTIHELIQGDNLPLSLRLLTGTRYIALTKGAVDGLLNLATSVWVIDQPEPMTPEWIKRIQQANDTLAQRGMRVLGVALRPLNDLPDHPDEGLEKELVIVGLIGMIDPPRIAVKPAIQTCKNAGIRPVMITGDHPLTAIAIAHDLEISEQPEAITGEMLNRMNDSELENMVESVSVFARVSPEDKLRIVKALQRRGQVVAMTGDGVNDSPALKKADIGVAMGITGTDVAKEAANMVLLDDNFATIVAAVEEGRVIYNNILRFIKFSLGGNLGKVLVMLCAPLLGINVALTPLQLLWLNLLTDGLMGLGLGVEPPESDTMRHPPRKPDNPVFDSPLIIYVSWVGILIAFITLALGALYLDPTQPQNNTWQTIIFTTLGFAQVGNALGLRATGRSPLSLTSNPLMTLVTLATIGLQLFVIYVPFMKQFFGLTPLALPDLTIAIAAGCLTFVCVQIEGRLHKHIGQ